MKKYLTNPTALIIFTISIITAGIISLYHLPMKMYPNVRKPGFYISFWHQDLTTSEEYYKTYGNSLIQQIKNIKDVINTNSQYQNRYVSINMELSWSADEEEIKQKLENIFTPLKSGSSNKFNYSIHPLSTMSSGNMMIAVSSDLYKDEDLKGYLESSLLQNIRKIEGVKNANFWGGQAKNHILEIDRDKIINFRLPLFKIINHIVEAYSPASIGTVQDDKKENSYIVRVDPKTREFSDLLEVPISLDDNNKVKIKVKDVATVRTILNKQKGVYRLNGKPSQMINVSLSQDSDVKQACDQVEKELNNFKQNTPAFDYNIMVNPGQFIQTAIDNLLINALIGGLAAIFIIFLFLRTFSGTLVIAISIPFCIITSFILMSIFNVSINIISLGGMAIGVGMIVDSSIVTLENIFKSFSHFNYFDHFNYGQQTPGKNPQQNKPDKFDIIISATKDVALPIIASIITSIVVFAPILYTSSYTKAIMGDLTRTIIFILSISIFSAIIIVPGVCSIIIKLPKRKSSNKYKPSNSDQETISAKLYHFYSKLLRIFLKRKAGALLIITIAVILTGASFMQAPKIKKSIIAKPTTRLLDVYINIPENDDVQLTKKVVSNLESFLKTQPEVKNYISYMFRPSNGYITIELKDRKQFDTLKDRILEKFKTNLDVQYTVSKWDPGKLPLPKKRDLEIILKGTKNSELSNFADKILDLKDGYFNGTIFRKPWLAKQEGISLKYKPFVKNNSLNQFLQAHTKWGTYLGDFNDQGKQLFFNLRFKDQQRSQYIEDIRNIPIQLNEKIVPLDALVDINFRNDSYLPYLYLNQDLAQKITINLDEKLTDEQKKSMISAVKQKIKSFEHPLELNINYPDVNKEINDSISSFKYSLLASVGLVLLTLAIMFNTIRYPFIILSTIPIALIGVLNGLYITKSTISLNSMLGTILLCGLVVNNAILMIDRYLKARKKNMGTNSKDINTNSNIDIIIETAKSRIRPILITTLTTLFAVIPMALGMGEGGEIIQPLGIAVFFGLLVSTLLTLFIIPSFLRLID